MPVRTFSGDTAPGHVSATPRKPLLRNFKRFIGVGTEVLSAPSPSTRAGKRVRDFGPDEAEPRISKPSSLLVWTIWKTRIPTPGVPEEQQY